MITQRKADTSRGQVGIGTLIVFIALVLVAAIAAGVLINTAGFLQTQAETTGQESTSQVSDNIQDLGAVGTVGTSSLDTDGETVDTVTELRIKVSSSPGSDNIDLNESTIEYIGPGGSTTLVNGTFNSGQRDASTDRTSGVLDSGKFGIRQIKSAADNTDPAREFVILDQSDRYELVINLDAFDNSPADLSSGTSSDNKLTDLREGEQATITITTAQGSQRVVEINVPDTLADKDSGDTVRV